MNKKQLATVIILTALSFLALGHVENFTFGLMDNAPMLVLMLMGLDSEGWLGKKLARFNMSPAYLACFVSIVVNTGTDGLAAALDVDASFWGVVLGCLVPIAFLPVVAMLKTKPVFINLYRPAAKEEALKPWDTFHAICNMPLRKRRAATIKGIEAITVALETAVYPQDNHFRNERNNLEEIIARDIL